MSSVRCNCEIEHKTHVYSPVENFRAFVHSLKVMGVDMGHVSISRSYAVLMGLEGYLSAKKGIKKSEQHVMDILNPQEARRRDEEQQDTSQSAQKERTFLEAQEAAKQQQSLSSRVKQKLSISEASPRTSTNQS